MNYKESIGTFLSEVGALHSRNLLAAAVTPGYFEPGMMENLSEYDGTYDDETGRFEIRFEAKGARYDGRSENIERVSVGDVICVVREKDNPFNSNNFTLTTVKGRSVGNMPAGLCDAIAPLYDEGLLKITSSSASYIEPLLKRSRHARQALLFVRMEGYVKRGE